ncbi:MAG: cytochrome B subunit [Bdellovibrio sp.]|nr:MAG: cytochrome B subunit [Bdellovibrio sp.]
MATEVLDPSRSLRPLHRRPFVCTSIGKKFLMGVTGLIWAGFVLTHMAANLLILISKDLYNAYGYAITGGAFIYVAETVLVLSLIVHVVTAVSLTIENRKARGSSYAARSRGAKAASGASLTMAPQGLIILVFIILHIATFKYGAYYETTVHGTTMRDLHRLVLEVFHQPKFVVWYLFALVILGVHLSHGLGSTIQSLGLKSETMSERWIKRISVLYGVVVATGFLSQPIYVYFFAD